MNQRPSVFVLLPFLLLAALSLMVCVFKPIHNWDMIGYIAAAKSFELRDPASLQAFTYEELREVVSEEAYERMAQEQEDGFLHAVRTDPSVFEEQLPFYQIRPIYIGLVYLLYKAGMNIAFATYAVSGLSVAAAVFLLYFLSVDFLPNPYAAVIPLIAAVFGLLDLARYSTPDGLAFLAVLMTAWLFLHKRFALLLVLLPVTLGIRTDLILFAIPLLLYLFVFAKALRWQILLSAAASVFLYCGIGAHWGLSSWSTVFYFALVEHLPHPITAPPTLSVQQYGAALFNGMKNMLVDKSFLLYAFVALCTVSLLQKAGKTKSAAAVLAEPMNALAIGCAIFIGIHFAAFPWTSDRYFCAQYVLAALSALVLFSDYLRGRIPVRD